METYVFKDKRMSFLVYVLELGEIDPSYIFIITFSLIVYK